MRSLWFFLKKTWFFLVGFKSFVHLQTFLQGNKGKKQGLPM